MTILVQIVRADEVDPSEMGISKESEKKIQPNNLY